MASSPDVGDRAPDFTLASTQGDVTLSERLEKRAVLLVFYPGDESPVCSKQLCDYQDHLGDFAGLGVDVLAINPQPLASHERFAKRHALTFPLLADAGGEVCRRYGAAGLFGTTKRALVLVGRDGRVLWRHTDFPIFRRSAEELRAKLAELGLGPAGA
jgi:peroxiredoxin Q/BCP